MSLGAGFHPRGPTITPVPALLGQALLCFAVPLGPAGAAPRAPVCTRLGHHPLQRSEVLCL